MKSPGVPRTLLNLAGRLVLVLALLGTASLVAVPVFADSVVTPGALQVTQISGGPAVVRQPITFTISVTNTTPNPVTGVTLGDTLPAGMTIANLLGPGGNPDLCGRTAGAGKNGTGPGFLCSMGDLGPGASATLSFTGTPTIAGPTTNQAVAQGCTGLASPPIAGVACVAVGGVFATITSTMALQVLANAPAPTPVTVPAAPTSATAFAGNAQASVSWVPPLSNGGSAITSYTVTSNPPTAPVTIAAPATSTTLTGLTNGTAYTFGVTATNAAGTSAASVASNSVTPSAPVVLTAPGAPTGVTAAAGDAQATVGWIAPLSNGGSAVTSYAVSVATVNGLAPATPISASVAAPATSATLVGLINGAAYTFTVTATNAVGTSAASGSSNTVTPVAPAAVPGPPTDVNARAGDGQATVGWKAPLVSGGSPITSYTVRVATENGAAPAAPITTTVSSPALIATLRGLTNGSTYTFTVTATNAAGAGAASAPSAGVTPGIPVLTSPAPTDVQVTGFATTNQPALGKVFSYIFQVKNNGDATATNVQLTDVLPAALAYSGGSSGCSQTGSVVTCQIGTLTRGSSAFVAVMVKAPTTSASIAKVASVAEANVDTRPSNNSFSVTVVAR